MATHVEVLSPDFDIYAFYSWDKFQALQPNSVPPLCSWQVQLLRMRYNLLVFIVSLDEFCPNVYNELRKANFSFLKTKPSFFRVTLNQLHKQNNEIIKGISDSKFVKNKQDDSALFCCVLKGPKLSEMTEQFEQECSDSD